MNKPSTPFGATTLLRVLLVGSIVVPLIVLAGGGLLAWDSTRDRAEVDLMRRVAIAEEHALKVLETHQLVAARVNDLVGNLSDEAIGIEERVLHEQLKQEIRNLPQVQTLLVVGRDGHVLLSAIRSIMGSTSPIALTSRPFATARRAS